MDIPGVDALGDGQWDDLRLSDILAVGRPARVPDASEQHLVIEVSKVVDVSDVERAHRRAGIVRSLGLNAAAIVDGESITPPAKAAAERLDVLVLVAKEAA